MKEALELGSSIYVGDTIFVDSDSAIQFQFLDESILELAANSKYLIKEYKYHRSLLELFTANTDYILQGGPPTAEGSSHTQLFYGGMRLLSGKITSNPDQYSIQTPEATLGLLGTLMEATSEKGKLSVACTKGRLQIKNEGGTVVIGEGMEQYAIVTSYTRRPRIYISPPPVLIHPKIAKF